MKLTKGDIIKINWTDAQTFIGEYSEMEDNDFKLQIVISVGIFIGEGKKSIVFADYKFLDKKETDYRYIHIIPKKMINNIKVLEKQKIKQKKVSK